MSLTSSAPHCTATVTDMLFCSEAPHIKPENPAQSIRMDTQMETRACFVRSQSQKGGLAAGASSTEKKMPVSFTKRSAVKLLRSFHRMVELTNTGAKLNLTGAMSVLTEGQMSTNAQLNGSSLWQQYDIVCSGLSPVPFLPLRFIFFGTVMATAISGASQPVPALEGLWMGPSDGVQVLFSWERSSAACVGHSSLLWVWISLLLSWAITSYCISFTWLEPGIKHHSRRLLVTHIARLDLFVIVSVLNTWACTSFSWFICFSQAEASNPVLRGPQSIRVFSPTRQTTAVTKETGLPGQSRCLSGKAETRWIRALAGLG